jgi:AraC family transcriptional regulator
MNLERQICAGGGVQVFRFWHPHEDEHVDPKSERADVTSVNFLEAGSFGLAIGRDSWELDESQCFVTRPGLVYRSKHREAVPTDIFVSVCYDEDVADEVFSAKGKGDARPVVRISNRAQYLLLRMKEKVRLGPSETLAVDLLARQLLAEALSGESRRQYSVPQIGWHTNRIEAARWILETDFHQQHSLRAVAKSVGMSPYHFAHIFAELTGMPPHRYLLRARLKAAACLLRDGADVTTACFQVGFNQLSHFSRMFRREYGCAPSRFRELKCRRR